VLGLVAPDDHGKNDGSCSRRPDTAEEPGPSAAQVEALAEAIAPPYGTLIRVAAYTGLRPCEFVALNVGRLDLLRRTVRVAEAAQLDPDGRPGLLPEDLRLYDLRHTAPR
jgi:integrase